MGERGEDERKGWKRGRGVDKHHASRTFVVYRFISHMCVINYCS